MKVDGATRAENAVADGGQSPPHWDQEQFVEQIWSDLDGAASRAHIDRVTMEIAPAYENARVKIFVPILLRRAVLQRLEEELQVDLQAKTAVDR